MQVGAFSAGPRCQGGDHGWSVDLCVFGAVAGTGYVFADGSDELADLFISQQGHVEAVGLPSGHELLEDGSLTFIVEVDQAAVGAEFERDRKVTAQVVIKGPSLL